MRSLPAHGRKRKFFRKGRHTAPSQVQKVAKRAGLAAPAVAVVGALAAAPHVHHRPQPATGPQAAASALAADQLQSSGFSDLAKLKAAYRPPHRAHHHHPRLSAEAQPAAAPSASTGTIVRKTAGKPGVHCSGASGPMLPENYPAIMEFLTEHGYTGVAAAGIAGNMYQESRGNPEAAAGDAGGLIGWTPLPHGYVTGDVAADLQTQLAGVLTFNDQFPQDVTVLNAAGSATAAADIYMNDFERPGYPAAANREAAAQAVAQACGL
ncbi:MAG: phage tail tip lysozyme [Streptosporangiaceae bacterium]